MLVWNLWGIRRMKTYVWVTFAFMGWAFYEASGGGDFAAQQPSEQITEVAPEPPTGPDIPVTEVIIRTPPAATTTLKPPEQAATPEAVELVEAPITSPARPDPATNDGVPPVVDVVFDIREVAGRRVNMRTGPGTDFGVVLTLDQGTPLEVLEVSETGWARIATLDRGIEGWMAERLLTEPDV